MQTPLTPLKFLLKQYGSRSIKAFIETHEKNRPVADTLLEKTLSQADFLGIMAAFLEADPAQPGTYHLSADVLRVLSSPALLAQVLDQDRALNIVQLNRYLAVLAPITAHAAELLVSRKGQILMAKGFTDALISADPITCQTLCRKDPVLDFDQHFLAYLDENTLLGHFIQQLGFFSVLGDPPVRADIFDQLNYDVRRKNITDRRGFFQFIHFFLTSVCARQGLYHQTLENNPYAANSVKPLLAFYIEHKFNRDPSRTAYANPITDNPVLADKERFLRVAISKGVQMTRVFLQSLLARISTIPEAAFQALDNPQWVSLINAQTLSLTTLFSSQWVFLQQLLAIEGVLNALQNNPTIWSHLTLVNQQVVITAFQKPALISLLQAHPEAWQRVLQLSNQQALDIIKPRQFLSVS